MIKILYNPKWFVLLFYIIWQSGTCVSAQIAQKWTNYTITDGLPENYIECIIEDQIGFLWIGTWNGISRFDGRDFHHYRKIINDSLSLPGNWIYCLYQDKQGTIWAGTDEGLAIYYPALDNFQPISGIKGHSIIAITEDQNGNLWVAGDNHLYEVHGRSRKLIYHHVFSSNSTRITEIGDIAVDRNNRLWIGTSNQGLLQFHINTRTIISPSKELKKLNFTHIKTILADNNGSLWLGTLQDGLFLLTWQDTLKVENFKSKKGLVPGFPDKRIRDIYLDRNKVVWFVNSNGFITKYVNGQFENFEIKKELIRSKDHVPTKCMLIDKNGNEWIGTHGNGLLNRNRQNERFMNFANASIIGNGNKIASFLPLDSNKILVGTDGGGLYTFYPKSNKFAFVNFHPNFTQSKILSMVATKTEIILGLWGNGLALLDRNSIKLKSHLNGKTKLTNKLSNLDVKYIIPNDSLILIATSGGGIFQYNEKNGLIDLFQIKSPIVINTPKWCNHILKDHKNRIWISTSKGLYLYNGVNLVKFMSENSDTTTINSNLVVGTYQDKKNRIWVLTDAGLQLFKETTSNFISFKQSTALNQQLKAIAEDKKGNLWISSNQGIICFNPSTCLIKQYGSGNGLPGNVFHHNAAAVTQDGYLLFGGLNGFTYFHPDSLPKSSSVAKPIFTDFLVDYIAQPRAKSSLPHIQTLSNITLPYANQTITFKFTSVDLKSTQNIRYAYQLLSQDNFWVEIGIQNFVSFTNLPPGNYRLNILAKNIDGIEAKEHASLQIEILPPWYLSHLAFAVYILALIGLLYVVYYVLTIRLRTRNKLTLQRFEHKKKLELFKAKIDFFTSISHDIRTPLTLIMAPLELLRSKINDNNDALKMLDIMDKNAHNLLSLTNELLEFKNLEAGERKLKLETTDLMPIVYNILDEFENEVLVRHISISKDLNPCLVKIDTSLFERVISNLLINAFKFTKDHGSIKVSLFSSKKFGSLSVFNSDSNISKELQSKIFDPFYTTNNEKGFGLGLATVKEIVQLHQGSIEISNQINGVTFTILIPNK